MTQLIAGLYEIQTKIGAGGGGVVYLGRHSRLNKLIVLKADKRTLSVGEDKLRREVDMLKNLRQTYIPQVYDFVQEDGVVYTVMDYIEGESLDRMLGRGEIPSQPDVIRWACQLLEALDYLHTLPPYGILHGDIKPANIMLRPNGDICLIDFNIALALGEDGAVKVGFSRGYASPEHYGADYISANRPAAVGPVQKIKITAGVADDKTLVEDDDKTLVEDDDKTLVDASISKPGAVSATVGSITRSQQGILLDARSDIYSLGATLYHLISGKRPALDAREVVPLGDDVCSPAVSAIIMKAMEPLPENRYQTAEEMLNAFLQLHKGDPRVVRHKRRMVTAVAGLTAVFLAGGGCSFVGLKQIEQQQEAKALAEYSANALAEGDVSEAVKLALQAVPEEGNIFEGALTAQAQKALTDALGVYNLEDGFHALDSLELPAVPFKIITSPDGTRLAVVYAYEVVLIDLATQRQLISFPIINSALADVIFIDENNIVYAGTQGVTAYSLVENKMLWSGEQATTLALSADRSVLAALDRENDFAVFYDAVSGRVLGERSFEGLYMTKAVNDIFADPGNDIFSLNKDGSVLAVSFDNGALVLFDSKNPDKDLILYEESGYTCFSGGFYEEYFAFSSGMSGEALFGLVDTKAAAFLGGYSSPDGILVKADERGIFVSNGNLLVEVNVDTLEEEELAYTNDVPITDYVVGEKYTLVATGDASFSFYDKGARLQSKEICTEDCDFLALTNGYAAVANRNEPKVRLLELESHEDKQLLSYEADYEHDEARISYDGKTAMLYNYRGFCIYDMQGAVIVEGELPDVDYIYDQQFRKSSEGSWLEVIWYDGTRRCYSAANGSLISEEVGAVPSKDLYEEFYVGEYRIASSLHSAPQVYNAKNGELVVTLEEDAYLTYVTELEDYWVTEYINTAGERYGLLLDKSWEVRAYLPKLCDVMGEKFVFDYETGDLRQISMYTMEELISLGNAYEMQ